MDQGVTNYYLFRAGATTEILEGVQDAFQGEAERVGLQDEQDVVEMI